MQYKKSFPVWTGHLREMYSEFYFLELILLLSDVFITYLLVTLPLPFIQFSFLCQQLPHSRYLIPMTWSSFLVPATISWPHSGCCNPVPITPNPLGGLAEGLCLYQPKALPFMEIFRVQHEGRYIKFLGVFAACQNNSGFWKIQRKNDDFQHLCYLSKFEFINSTSERHDTGPRAIPTSARFQRQTMEVLKLFKNWLKEF